MQPHPTRPISLEHARLLKALGLLGVFQRDTICTRCGWPTHGVIHQDTCAKRRKAKRATPAPSQPWNPRPLREAA